MAEELKACPFCGGIPKTSHRPESKASGGGHVAFVVCYCGGYASTAHQMGHAETVQAAIAEVVEKWNTRAQLPSQGGEAVATDAFVPGSLADLLFQLGEKGIRVSGGTHGDHWRVSPLYTHPADQVEDDLTMVKVSRELLEDLRDLAFDQVEHHRAAMGAYKQTRQSAMDSVLAQADALLRS